MPLNHIHKMVKVVNIILWAFHTKNEGAAHLFTCLSEYQIPFLLPPPLTCPGSFLFPAFSKLTLRPWALLGWRILHLQPHMLSFLALGRGIYPRALCAARATDLHQDVEWGTLTSGKTLRVSELCVTSTSGRKRSSFPQLVGIRGTSELATSCGTPPHLPTPRVFCLENRDGKTTLLAVFLSVCLYLLIG